jgi:hypothetical protein
VLAQEMRKHYRITSENKIYLFRQHLHKWYHDL